MIEWKGVNGYDGLYEISNTGLVRSLDRTRNAKGVGVANIKGVVLKQIKKDGIYKVVTLSKYCKTKTYYVHRLVAEHFIGEVPNGMVVNHIDHNIYNNHYSNLEIITRRDNTYHGLKNKKHSSKYAGVYWNKARSKWVAMTRIRGSKKIYLGGFEKEKDAHLAIVYALEDAGIRSVYVTQ